MNLRTALTTAAILLAVANPTYAKLGVKVDVQVSDAKIKNTLQESMKASLNSTKRYVATDIEADTELLMSRTCFGLTEARRGNTVSSTSTSHGSTWLAEKTR